MHVFLGIIATIFLQCPVGSSNEIHLFVVLVTSIGCIEVMNVYEKNRHSFFAINLMGLKNYYVALLCRLCQIVNFESDRLLLATNLIQF